MIRLLPFLLVIGYALVMWHVSAHRLKAHLDARSKPLADPDLTAALEPLAQALSLKAIPVRVYEIEGINGLAAPDGQVYLTQGFLAALRAGSISRAEMASVVAHELGHVALGHAKRRMVDVTGQSLMRLILMGVFARVLPLIGPWIAHFLTSVLAAKLSRKAEFEADAWGAALMMKSGYGLAPQIALLSKLDALTGAARPPEWLATHPPTEERVAALRALEARWTGRA